VNAGCTPFAKGRECIRWLSVVAPVPAIDPIPDIIHIQHGPVAYPCAPIFARLGVEQILDERSGQGSEQESKLLTHLEHSSVV
jgi:hypothetical protein